MILHHRHFKLPTWLRSSHLVISWWMVWLSLEFYPCHIYTVGCQAFTSKHPGPLELKLPQLPVGYISRRGASKSPQQLWEFLLLCFLANSLTHSICSRQHAVYLELWSWITCCVTARRQGLRDILKAWGVRNKLAIAMRKQGRSVQVSLDIQD